MFNSNIHTYTYNYSAFNRSHHEYKIGKKKKITIEVVILYSRYNSQFISQSTESYPVIIYEDIYEILAQWIRRWSTKPEILGSIPSRPCIIKSFCSRLRLLSLVCLVINID